jgi:hypothetical protein
MFAKQSGSPVGLRTYDPSFTSPHASALFSALAYRSGCTQVMRNVWSQAQNACSFAGISCVFVCIFLLPQREMRGYVLQLSSGLRLSM